jgi:hemerythrin-like domain-containing protein
MTTIAQATVEELKDLYCDMHKDVHGVKGRWIYGGSYTHEELVDMINRLELEWVEVEAREREQQQAAADAARRHIQNLMDMGAQDEAMVIRWMHDAYGTGGDHKFLDWELGVEYGFIEGILQQGL